MLGDFTPRGGVTVHSLHSGSARLGCWVVFITKEVAMERLKVINAEKVMHFGKFRGRPVCEVDQGYLVWCRDNLDQCPTYIFEELKARKISREASLSPKHRKRIEALKKRKLKQANKIKAGVPTEGQHYQRLSAEFDRADGDSEACPFDDGKERNQYTGPTIRWNGGNPIIIPSEFPKEFR